MSIQKKYKKLILAVVIITLAIVGILYYNKIQNNKEAINKEVAVSQFITEKDPKLTDEERKIVEDRLGEIQEQINSWETATDKEKYVMLMQFGFQKNVLGKLVEARDSFLEAKKYFPENHTAPVALFHVYADMGDNDSALANIKKAIELSQGNADSWRQYIQFEKERFGATDERLTELFIEAIEKASPNTDILTIYAQFLEEKGDLEEAIEQWQKVIESYPESKDVYQAEITRIENNILKVN